MDDRSRIPTYNMKVVVQETGIKPDTLRAWERRYQLPNPHRTSGGHRLYSQRDIDMLRWFMARQDEGLSIKRAVNLWQQIESEERDPLDEYDTDHPEIALPRAVAADSSVILGMRRDWINACLAFDSQTSQTVLAEAFAIFPPETVVIRLLQKGLAEIGDGWFSGDISVQQEHFAAEIALRQVESLLISSASLPITQAGKIIVVCPPEELHTFIALVITLLLRRRGWDIVYIGANTPVDQLASTVQVIQPRLVIFAAQTLRTASTLLDAASLMFDMMVPVAYGGRVFAISPDVKGHLPGYYLGNEVERIPDKVFQIMKDPEPKPAAIPVTSEYRQALLNFHRLRPALESYIQVKLSGMMSQFPDVSIATINKDFGNDVEAALRLGDIRLIEDNLQWLRELLENIEYPTPIASLNIYLEIYREAAHEVLGTTAAPFVDWLTATVENEKAEL